MGRWYLRIGGAVVLAACARPSIPEAVPRPQAAAPPVEEAPRDETPAPRPPDPVAEPRGRVGVIARWAEIYAEARSSSPRLGRMRAGQTVILRDGPRPVGGDDRCPMGFVAIEPRGYVCRNRGTTGDMEDPTLRALAKLLPREEGLPFRYAHARGIRHYHHAPTEAQLRMHERQPRPREEGLPDTDDELTRYLRSPRPGVPVRADVYDGRSVAWAQTVVLDGRRWHVTPWPSLIPAIDESTVPPSAGRALESRSQLPFAFANGRPFGPVFRYRGLGWGFAPIDPLPPWSFLELEGEAKQGMVPLVDGSFVRADAVNVFAADEPPDGIGHEDKWVSVHLARETLVAYEGARPVYAAAVSTGAHGAMGPLRTAYGTFRVTSRWRTHTMSGLNLDGSGYRAPEVPFVSYYDRGRALHGAWWHDWFGHPRSHGCVNLAPADAAWLHRWLEPAIPNGWYAVVARGDEGTRVVVQR